ncbi:MAG TPA: protoporphyrinogen oxidase [Acidimicrobiales bacterium]|nr:protoporphyrinogen oxidase [Acidimicrobiales bacterium]
MSRASVVVVGGGVAGLAAAWELSGGASGPSASTPRVEVIEPGEKVGGTLAVSSFAGRTIDVGPDGFLARRPEATQLINELGLADELVPIGASGASIYLRGALHEIPMGLALGVPTSYQAVASMAGLSWRARLGAKRDQWFPARLGVAEDISIGEIVRTKLGRELAYQFIEPMVGGIQAGRIDELSAKSIFPALYDAARAGGSLMRALARPATVAGGASASPSTPPGPLFATLRGGIGSLPGRLVELLGERGVAIRTSTSVVALRATPRGPRRYDVDTPDTTTPADAVVLATPGTVTGTLAGALDPAIAALASIRCASTAMVTLAVARDALRLDFSGTGALVPLGTPFHGDTMLVTAITLLERKWPYLAEGGGEAILRVHVGRSDDTRFAALSDEQLVERVSRELATILGDFPTPSEALVRRFDHALPQYLVGHDALIGAAKAAAAPLHLALAGNAYDGVGIPASIGSGRRAAREILASLGETPERRSR